MSRTSSTSLTETRTGRLVLFGFLYFVQGTILSYVFVFNNLYVRTSGGTPQQLSLLNGVLALPFVAKFFIGIMSDRSSLFGRGHRRPYIVIGTLLMGIGSFLVAEVNPVRNYPLFVLLALLLASGLAIFDTTIDGFAVDATPGDQQGEIQGIMVVGRSIGFVMMAAVYGRLIDTYGWPVVFYWIAALSLLPFAVLWRAREPAQRPPRQQFQWRALRALARPAVGNLALYAIIHAWVIYSANNLLPLYINETLGRTLVEVGDVAVLISLGTLAGGLLSTVLVQRFTIWQIGRMVAVLAILNLLALSLPGVTRFADGALIVWGVTLAAADFMYVTLSMMRADPRLGAGSYALFMAMSNFFIGIGQATTTRLIDTVSYQTQFVALAVLGLLFFPLLRRLQRDDPLMIPAQPPAEVGTPPPQD